MIEPKFTVSIQEKKQQTRSPEISLFMAVIHQAFHDLENAVKKSNNNKDFKFDLVPKVIEIERSGFRKVHKIKKTIFKKKYHLDSFNKKIFEKAPNLEKCYNILEILYHISSDWFEEICGICDLPHCKAKRYAQNYIKEKSIYPVLDKTFMAKLDFKSKKAPKISQ